MIYGWKEETLTHCDFESGGTITGPCQLLEQSTAFKGLETSENYEDRLCSFQMHFNGLSMHLYCIVLFPLYLRKFTSKKKRIYVTESLKPKGYLCCEKGISDTRDFRLSSKITFFSRTNLCGC
jgi:hypothetical protein